MRIFTILFLQIILLGCPDRQTKRVELRETVDTDSKNVFTISIINVEFPLRLNKQ